MGCWEGGRVSSGSSTFWGSSNNESLKWLRFDRVSVDEQAMEAVRGEVTRMTGDVTVMGVTSTDVGDGVRLVQ